MTQIDWLDIPGVDIRVLPEGTSEVDGVWVKTVAQWGSSKDLAARMIVECRDHEAKTVYATRPATRMIPEVLLPEPKIKREQSYCYAAFLP